MPVDPSTYIGGFNTTLPTGADSRTEADNNFRQVKTAAKNTLPNCTGPVTASHTELSHVAGVTSAIQTQLNSKAPLASPTFTGTPIAPTAPVGAATTQIATTAFTQSAIADVNATTGLARSFTASTGFAVTAGQLIACTAATAWAAMFPPSPSVGAVCGVASQNNLATNSIDFGANSVIGANGTAISGVVTLDQVKPVYQFAWYGDYWREA